MSFIVYTRNISGKRVTNAKLKKANDAHREFLASIINASSVTPTRISKRKAISVAPIILQTKTSDAIPVSGGYKRTVDDYKWRRDVVETVATIQEIALKKTRLAPIYSKGPVQYISDETDLTTIGKKL